MDDKVTEILFISNRPMTTEQKIFLYATYKNIRLVKFKKKQIKSELYRHLAEREGIVIILV